MLNPQSAILCSRGLFDFTPTELGQLLESWAEPTYRAGQVLEWVYRRGVASYEEMTNLPTTLRARLSVEVPLYTSTIDRKLVSSDGTVKLLIRWPDGARSECVLIPDDPRRTACLSTQVGCPVGCRFCASGLGGLERQLLGGQIVEQAMRISRLCDDEFPLSNIVFMGLGEPLANYRATVQAVRTINADWGLGIGARKITLSTVGMPERIRQLADERMQITLAISLHAPTDELRSRIIPWARRGDIEALVQAANYYFERTGREVTLEYLLLGGVNDTPQHARDLCAIAKRMRSHVNLLLYNRVDGLEFQRPVDTDVQRFLAVLRERGVNVHLRKSRGLDVDAACGQLRRRTLEDSA
ncbi:MAG: 23S rRNA (adenine(2503)-C(2))-methyltransferase RlmN [Planctomycetes bacterium]|nr:23S rRNA (adenine(2503)-C(2))-methyltransferase RlmN [Planctomycetota bacterium]